MPGASKFRDKTKTNRNWVGRSNVFGERENQILHTKPVAIPKSGLINSYLEIPYA